MTQVLYAYREIFFFLGTLALILLATGLGFYFGSLRQAAEDQGSNLLQTSMLTLLSLLLAFGVSMAEVRYEVRKQGEMEESNAIGTSYLRARQLSGESSATLKKLLKAYLQRRIESYQSSQEDEPSTPLGRELGRLQEEIWTLASDETLRTPTVDKSLLLVSLNQSFDLREKQQFTYRNRVPFSIIGMLYLSSVIVSCLVGFLNARKPTRHLAAITALALMISMTLFVILDLDRPRNGLIRVHPESLIRLQEGIGSGS